MIILPILFSWWLFIPMALLLVYLARVPYELLFAGVILDSVYYFGENIFLQNQFFMFASVVVILALILNNRIHWQKII